MRRLLAVVPLALALLVLPAAVASAHPLGNFTLNLFSGIRVLPGEIRIEYVIDMAEIPTFQELSTVDADGDGAPETAELSDWAELTAGRVAHELEIVVDGRAAQPVVRSASAELRPGQAGLDVLRFEGIFSVTSPASAEVRFADGNFADRIGWREVVVSAGDGVALRGSTVPAESVSRALTSYPRDLLSETLDVRAATFSYERGGAAASLPTEEAPAGVPGADGFVGLVARGDISAAVVATSFLLSIAFGALHAMGPGHGKALMAAFLVGTRTTSRDAVAMGAAVAAMHTASVVALGLVVISAERLFPPERVYPWLGLLAGSVAVALGARMLVVRVAALRRRSGHHAEHEHQHRPLSRRGMLALATAGGILPSPTALVVLLASAALHRVAFGLVLIAGFSLGLAGSLIGVGLAATRARELAARRSWTQATRVAPVLSAAAIVAIGSLLALRGLAQL